MDRLSFRHWGMLAVAGVGMANGIFACSSDDDPAANPGNDGGPDTGNDVSNGNVDGGSDAALLPIDCEVAIVGGGAGRRAHGVQAHEPTGRRHGHRRYVEHRRLLCSRRTIGSAGRFRDVQFGPNANDVTGTGGYRCLRQSVHRDARDRARRDGRRRHSDSPNLRGLQNPLGDASVGQVLRIWRRRVQVALRQ